MSFYSSLLAEDYHEGRTKATPAVQGWYRTLCVDRDGSDWLRPVGAPDAAGLAWFLNFRHFPYRGGTRAGSLQRTEQ